MDAAVQKAYGGKKKIHWLEIYAGEKSFKAFNSWLPDETVEACREYLVSIKGPLTTPVGGGIRSLNVALRQLLDLYVCLRPVRWFKGVPSPVKAPEKVDMVIFRENTEDIYAGIEFEHGTEDNKKFKELFKQAFPKAYAKIRFPDTSGIGFKPVSQEGTERLFKAALLYAIDNKRRNVTIVHKGNIQKFTEGAFRNWAYALAESGEFASKFYTWEQWGRTKAASGEKAANDEQAAALKSGRILVKDAIADIALQQVLTRPDEFDVIATTNLNGDYLSDALAAQVGGIGIAPGANINYVTGHAVFEATHGTAPKYAEPRQGEPGLGDPVGRDDAALHGLDRGGRRHHLGDGQDHRAEDRDLRLRAPDGRREEGEVLGVRRRADPQHVVVPGKGSRVRERSPDFNPAACFVDQAIGALARPNYCRLARSPAIVAPARSSDKLAGSRPTSSTARSTTPGAQNSGEIISMANKRAR